MRRDRVAPGGRNLELARRLIPREANDFGRLAHDKTAEAASHAGVDATLTTLHAIGRVFETLIAFPELYVDLGDQRACAGTPGGPHGGGDLDRQHDARRLAQRRRASLLIM